MNFQVDIKANNPNNSDLIRAIRTLSPELKQNQATEIAKYICTKGKATIITGVSIKVANHIKNQLNIEGIQVHVSESSINDPMIIFPSANEKWKWSNSFTIEKQ